MPQEGMRNHLLNNCRTKVFFANDCPDTSFYFERLLGTKTEFKSSVALVPPKPVPRFLLPNYRFAPVPRFAVESMSCMEEVSPRLKREDLGSLPNGSAIIVGRGLKITHFQHEPVLYGSGE
jgi:hypothetical protein